MIEVPLALRQVAIANVARSTKAVARTASQRKNSYRTLEFGCPHHRAAPFARNLALGTSALKQERLSFAFLKGIHRDAG
ncbi:MAG: hypothetical protein HKN70_04530 [Gammaproteobacteria bacterium]|nr:hypothetical protein [Gammaproteobacteria bacterium]